MREGESREFGARKVLKGTVCAPHCAQGVWCVQMDQVPQLQLGCECRDRAWRGCVSSLCHPQDFGGVRGLQPPPHTAVGLWGMQQSLCLLALQMSCLSAWLFPLVGRCGIIKESPGPSGWAHWGLLLSGTGCWHQSCALQQGPKRSSFVGEENKEKWL